MMATGRDDPATALSLPRKWRLLWRDELPCRTGVYLRRWGVETPYGSVRLHHWLYSDDVRAPHDHPWPFWTFVFWGRYFDAWTIPGADTPIVVTTLTAPCLRYRPAEHLHSVVLKEGETCWSLLVTGPIIRRWGFLSNGRWQRSEKYFARNGAHPCE